MSPTAGQRLFTFSTSLLAEYTRLRAATVDLPVTLKSMDLHALGVLVVGMVNVERVCGSVTAVCPALTSLPLAHLVLSEVQWLRAQLSSPATAETKADTDKSGKLSALVACPPASTLAKVLQTSTVSDLAQELLISMLHVNFAARKSGKDALSQAWSKAAPSVSDSGSSLSSATRDSLELLAPAWLPQDGQTWYKGGLFPRVDEAWLAAIGEY